MTAHPDVLTAPTMDQGHGEAGAVTANRPSNIRTKLPDGAILGARQAGWQGPLQSAGGGSSVGGLGDQVRLEGRPDVAAGV